MIFFFKQKTAYERRISDWSSDVCSSDLGLPACLRRILATLDNIAVRSEPEGLAIDDAGHALALQDLNVAGGPHGDPALDGMGADGPGQRMGAAGLQRSGPLQQFFPRMTLQRDHDTESGRAPCVERVCQYV